MYSVQMVKLRNWIIASTVFFLSSCATEQKIFYQADVIGFGEDVQTSYSYEKGAFKNMKLQSKPVDMLKNASELDRTIQKVIPRGNNTTLYYATDIAVDRIKWVRKNIAKRDKTTKYYIFLLTDGLDNASVHAAKVNKQAVVSSPESYRERIESRLKHATGLFKNENDLTVYPMLRVGKDIQQIATDNNLSERDFKEYLDRQFACFRYSSDGEAPELIQEKDWKDIEKVVENQIVNNTLDFRVAKDYKGKRIRMTMTDQNGVTGTIEGTLKSFFGAYKLVDIETNGVKIDERNSVFVKQEGKVLNALKDNKKDGNIFFTVSGLREADGGKMFQPKQVRQSIYDGELWQANTEYEQKPDVRPNAYCIFVIDGSLSLTDEDVQAEIECVKKIIRTIYPSTKL